MRSRRGWSFNHPPNIRFRANVSSPQSADLAAWWPTLGIAGSRTLRDLVQANNVAIPAAYTWVSSPMFGWGLTGDNANSMSSEVNADQIVAPAGGITISCWMRGIDDGDDGGLISLPHNDGTETFSLRIAWVVDALRGQMTYRTGGDLKQSKRYDGLDLNDNAAHHIAAAAGPDTVDIYIDGIYRTGQVAGANYNLTNTCSPDSSAILLYETGSGENLYGGTAFDFRIYDRALSAAEIWQLYAPETRWDLYKPEPRIFVIPRGIITGEVSWGHVTGVLEENIKTFTGNWTGTGSIEGAGDGETICLHEGEEMVSEVVDTGTYTVTLLQNNYAVGDDVTLSYRHGATQAACEVAGWNAYVAPFVSLGYVQAKVSD